jgi:K+ transporter
MIAVSLLTMWGLRNQPKAPYDPVGAAAIPFWTAAIILCLAVVLLVRAITGRGNGGSAASMFTSTEAADDSYSVVPALSLYSIVVSLGYAALIPAIGFMAASVGYMLVLGWILSDRSPRATAIVVIVAVVGGVGLDVGFRALLVDLP